ncbi:MAG: thiol peroxidase [Akkermansiaceae bacterium]
MAQITFKGTPVNTSSTLPAVGSAAPDFSVVNTDLSTVSLADFAGKKVVINVFPSVDTGVCAMQLKSFNQKVDGKDDVALLFVSLDLPFALGRFCGAEGIKNAVTTSDFRDQSFANAYGVKLVDGPLAGLLSRAVIVLDESHNVTYSELVSEITNEPDYDAAMAAL